MTLSVNRGAHPAQVFVSWTAYLSSRGGGETSLCRALAVNNNRIFEYFLHGAEDEKEQAATPEEEARADARLNHALEQAGEPWVTPVLGSGCHTTAEVFAGDGVHSVPRQVAAQLENEPPLPDGTLPAEAALDFATALVASKTTGATPTSELSEPADDRPRVDRAVAARAVLCAHLLARLHFEVGALRRRPLEDPSTPIQFQTDLSGPTPGGAELFDLLVVPLLAQLGELKRNVVEHTGKDDHFVARFADLVGEDLERHPPRVRASDAALMAEIAWHFMTERTSHYPGWSDLLVQLAIAFNSTERQLRWPYLTDLETARLQLRHDLLATTQDSWTSRTDTRSGTTSARDDLYDNVAELLLAQAGRVAPDTEHHLGAPPAAVAYVTSFDLELEMALLTRQKPFRIVMPFYTRSTRSQDANGYVWLQALVTPPARKQRSAVDLELVTSPLEWSLLSTRPRPEDEMRGVPVVVRLTGCPLVQGPDLETADGAWVDRLRGRLPGVRLAGTVILDEHTALHQWAADLGAAPAYPGETSGQEQIDHRDRLGLPERFVKGTNNGDIARFWLLLGVQLRDPAIRQRTAALVAAAHIRPTMPKDARQPRPDRNGVIVNRRSTPNQRDVFLWQGLDVVVEEDCTVVGPALAHAAEHVAQPERRRQLGDACKVSRKPS